jgi:L-seryl-tRNA(Ser) seleniumtransferase
MTLAALEAVMRLYRDERAALERIPTLRMISTPVPVLEERAHRLAELIRQSDGQGRLKVEPLPGESQVGGGSLPAQSIETRVVAVSSPAMSTQRIEHTLRHNRPPVIGRIESDRFLLDVRTILVEQMPVIQEAFRRLCETS